MEVDHRCVLEEDPVILQAQAGAGGFSCLSRVAVICFRDTVYKLRRRIMLRFVCNHVTWLRVKAGSIVMFDRNATLHFSAY